MFIQGKMYKQLREAAKNGDERAKKILIMQNRGESEGFDGLLNEYFSPKQEEQKQNDGIQEFSATNNDNEPKNIKLERFLVDNDVHEGDPDYEEMVKMYYQENPNENEPEKPEVPENVLEQMEKMKPEDTDKLLSNLALSNCEEAVKELIKNAIKNLIADELEAQRGYFSAIQLVQVTKGCKTIEGTLKSINSDEERHVEMLKAILKIFEKDSEEKEFEKDVEKEHKME